jgi:hypothetical protein
VTLLEDGGDLNASRPSSSDCISSVRDLHPVRADGTRVPKVWDEAALAVWATPIAELRVPPTNMSADEYYAMTIENVRSYPVYFPGREPDGYWKMLQRIGPQPLIEPERLSTEADWIRGREKGLRRSRPSAPAHLRSGTDSRGKESGHLQGRGAFAGWHSAVDAMDPDEERRCSRILELQQLSCAAVADGTRFRALLNSGPALKTRNRSRRSRSEVALSGLTTPMG